MDTTTDICEQFRDTLGAMGISSLHPAQGEVISRILSPDGVRRRIVVLPTGAGKSLCYMLPSLRLKGKTVVIYPLRALLVDQARRCREAALEHNCLIGGKGSEERKATLDRISRQTSGMVLATPETLRSLTAAACSALQPCAHFVIDESHVVSLWGKTFRPIYRELGTLIESLAPEQVSAFTATADSEVLGDLRELVGPDHDEYRENPDRPNLSIHVKVSFNPVASLASLFSRPSDGESSGPKLPAIAYLRNRRACEDLSRQLRRCDVLRSSSVRFYHAGLSASERAHVEHWFANFPEALLVSTNAFGMGVDCKQVRTVIHLGLPDGAASYLQEIGRAGRDGRPGDAHLFWNPQHESSAHPLSAFVRASTCRRQILLQEFGFSSAPCGNCDRCLERDYISEEYAELHRIVRNNRRLLTKSELVAEFAARFPRSSKHNVESLISVCVRTGLLRYSTSPLSWKRLDARSDLRDHGNLILTNQH